MDDVVEGRFREVGSACLLSQVFVSPLSPTDWSLVQADSAKVEREVLNQVSVVGEGMVLPIHLGGACFAHLSVDEVRCSNEESMEEMRGGIISSGSELVIAPNEEEEEEKGYEGEEGNGDWIGPSVVRVLYSRDDEKQHPYFCTTNPSNLPSSTPHTMITLQPYKRRGRIGNHIFEEESSIPIQDHESVGKELIVRVVGDESIPPNHISFSSPLPLLALSLTPFDLIKVSKLKEESSPYMSPNPELITFIPLSSDALMSGPSPTSPLFLSHGIILPPSTPTTSHILVSFKEEIRSHHFIIEDVDIMEELFNQIKVSTDQLKHFNINFPIESQSQSPTLLPKSLEPLPLQITQSSSIQYCGIISGHRGCGKTFILRCLLNEVRRSPHNLLTLYLDCKFFQYLF